MNQQDAFTPRQKRIYEIICVGELTDWPSRTYDFINCFAIVLNIGAGLMLTFDTLYAKYGALLMAVEGISIAFFALDYLLHLYTAQVQFPRDNLLRAVFRYVKSFNGVVDLLSFLPYYLPVFFPAGAAVFRMFRVVRIFRLFRINAYHDSLTIIAEVITSKRQQLLSSVFIISIFMVASSLCMYSIEHDAQPDVFENAFSGIWWAVSTLLTVGYGDIYPITTLGKLLSIFITFLGVGMVAIPTGIISAGFVDQYSRIKRISEYANESDVHFIKLQLSARDSWAGKTVKELRLPHGVLVAAIQRKKEIIVPRGSVMLEDGDVLVLGAESMGDDKLIDLKELVLKKQSPWNGQHIRDLDISRQTVIVMVKRRGRMLIPNGELVLREGDKVMLYSRVRIGDTHELIV